MSEIVNLFGLTNSTRDLNDPEIFTDLYNTAKITNRQKVNALSRQILKLQSKYKSGITYDRLTDIEEVLNKYNDDFEDYKTTAVAIRKAGVAPAPVDVAKAEAKQAKAEAKQAKAEAVEKARQARVEAKQAKEDEKAILAELAKQAKAKAKQAKEDDKVAKALLADARAKLARAETAELAKQATADMKAAKTLIADATEDAKAVADAGAKAKADAKAVLSEKMKKLITKKKAKSEPAEEEPKKAVVKKAVVKTTEAKKAVVKKSLSTGGKAKPKKAPAEEEPKKAKPLVAIKAKSEPKKAKPKSSEIVEYEEQIAKLQKTINRDRGIIADTMRPLIAENENALISFLKTGIADKSKIDALKKARDANPDSFKILEERAKSGEDMFDLLGDIEIDPDFAEFEFDLQNEFKVEAGLMPEMDELAINEKTMSSIKEDLQAAEDEEASDVVSGEGFVDLIQRGMGRNNNVMRVESVENEDKKYAEIANAVYYPPQSRQKLILGYRLMDTKEFNQERRVVYGKSNDDIIIAYRGTSDGRDLQTDLKLAMGNLKSSFRFKKDLDWTHNLMSGLKPNKVVFTGHSLGGTIAIEMTDTFRGNTRAVVFNAGQGIKMGNRNHLNVKFYTVKGDFVSMLGTGAYKDVRILSNENTRKNKTPKGAHSTANFDVENEANYIDDEEQNENEEESEDLSGGGLYSNMKSRLHSVKSNMNARNFKEATKHLNIVAKLNEKMPESYKIPMLNEINTIREILVG
tara:strand:- start:19 stop:2259 length:2241 start_codon:yes stop_codon:yes gene_type:complete